MGFLKKPKKPEPTAQEVAITQRQERALDEEIGENEQRLRAQRRGQLGTRSLLAGAPGSRSAAASGMGRGKGAATSMPKTGAYSRASILQGIQVRGIGGGM
jgi:hypothetical protein